MKLGDSVLEYKGRLPKRSSSLEKRNQILQASLEIIRDQGLRGVRHRAVAELAQVPLAATTYYFSDIDELIIDSFVFFMQENLPKQQAIFTEIINSFKYKNSNELEPQAYLHKLLEAYLINQISERDNRKIERSFIQLASRVPDLSARVLQIQMYFESQIIEILRLLKVKQPKFKAHLIMAFINLTEERALLSSDLNVKKLNSNIQKLLEKTLY